MAGKSTLIKAVGTTAPGTPGHGCSCKRNATSIFDGILSNINVVDNIVKGESYFLTKYSASRIPFSRSTMKKVARSD